MGTHESAQTCRGPALSARPIRSSHGRWERVLSLANAAARGGAATLAGQLARFLIQLLSVVILTRLIAPSDFGVYAMVIAIIGVASVLGDFGLSMAAIQSQTITQQQRSNLFWTNTGVGLVLFLSSFFAAPLIAAFYDRPELTDIARWLALTFLLNSLMAQFRAEVSTKLKFTWLAAADVAASAVALIAAVSVAAGGLGYWALVVQQIVIAAVTLIILVIAARWLPSMPRRGADMRALYTYGINTLGVQLLTYVTSNIDSILIGRVWGASSLGLYDRAYQLFRLPLLQIAAPMTKVAMPILSKLQADARYESYVQRAQLVLSYCFGGTFLLLAAVSVPAIDIMLGPGWDPAKPIFAILAIGGVFQGIGFVYYWVFLSRALTGLQLRWTVIARSLMIAGVCVGVVWGPIGVAIALTAGQAVSWLLMTVFPMAKTGLQRRPLLAIAVRPIVVFMPMTVLSLLLSYTLIASWNEWLQLAVLLVAIGGYLGLSLLVPAIRRDYLELWDVARRIRR
ncbi:lipopolysaccharide biosynthesis protein [Microbacterium sp. P01]|uniref:lipopolysaccharide biosynthesis protein n=1 Tax=unclassified Microbacterium TaxID=2609290 RepID=UPI00366C411D